MRRVSRFWARSQARIDSHENIPHPRDAKYAEGAQRSDFGLCAPSARCVSAGEPNSNLRQTGHQQSLTTEASEPEDCAERINVTSCIYSGALPPWRVLSAHPFFSFAARYKSKHQNMARCSRLQTDLLFRTESLRRTGCSWLHTSWSNCRTQDSQCCHPDWSSSRG